MNTSNIIKVVCIKEKGLKYAGVEHSKPAEKLFSEKDRYGFELSIEAAEALCSSGMCAPHSHSDAKRLASSTDKTFPPFFVKTLSDVASMEKSVEDEKPLKKEKAEAKKKKTKKKNFSVEASAENKEEK